MGRRSFEGRQRTISVILVALFTCAGMVLGALLPHVMGSEHAVLVLVVCTAVIVVAFIAFIRLINLDNARSQFTEETLSVASLMLEDLKGGLNAASARAVCERLLPETRASTIAITDTAIVLASVGDLADVFPAGSPIHTPATHYVIEHGFTQSFIYGIALPEGDDAVRAIPAGIISPLKVRGKTVGTLKFYFSSPSAVNRTQYALVSGFAELLSTQLATHELELQEELTARAEVRALQAQINPHFLFNTLNTIAAFTRTDPTRARELLREFSVFYRSTLDNSGSLIPVSREIAQVKRYLTFEQARFGEDRIQASFEVEEGVEEEPVPAFVIQPLVENAVRHAMRDDEPLHITVSVRSDGDGALGIVVSDDGAGMDKGTAARLFERLGDQPDIAAPQGGGAGVAMHNISERIKRFYGPRSFVHIDSAPGEGTTITFHLDTLRSIFAEG